MILRVFLVMVHEGRANEFEEFFRTISSCSTAKGLSLSIRSTYALLGWTIDRHITAPLGSHVRFFVALLRRVFMERGEPWDFRRIQSIKVNSMT